MNQDKWGVESRNYNVIHRGFILHELKLAVGLWSARESLITMNVDCRLRSTSGSFLLATG